MFYCLIKLTLVDNLILSIFQSCEMVSVIFCEVVELGSTSTMQEVMDVINCMNAVFTCFDALTDRFDVYKVSLIRYKVIKQENELNLHRFYYM